MRNPDILQGYAADAPQIIASLEAISVERVLASVIDLLPHEPCRVLDAGAGTARNSAWFADQGHRVVAAEPVREFREAGAKLHPSPAIIWVADRLPELNEVKALGEKFDLLMLSGVWQHLRADERGLAMASLAELAATGARLVMSLRHGPGSPTRPCFPCDPAETIADAARAGLELVRRREAASIQQKNRDAGVTWTWLVFNAHQGRSH